MIENNHKTMNSQGAKTMLRMAMIVCLTVTLLLIPVASAQADIIQFREGGGVGYVDVTFDDTFLQSSSPDGASGNETPLRMQSLANQNRASQVALVGLTDLFQQLPAIQSGKDIVINQAQLVLTKSNSTTGTLAIANMTTDWLLNGPGSNEDNVTWNHANAAGAVGWANGANFFPNVTFNTLTITSADNFDLDSLVLHDWTGVAGTQHAVDITDIVASWYATGDNFGVVMYRYGGASGDFRVHTSEATTIDERPVLIIDYSYVIPEPASMALLGLGGLVMLSRRRVTR